MRHAVVERYVDVAAVLVRELYNRAVSNKPR
jgi:hypothetical protein